MTHIEVARELHSTPAQLYSTISNPSTWGNWFSVHEGFLETPPEQLSVDSRLVQNIRMLGMTQKLELVIAEFKPPMQLTMRGTSAVGVTCEFTFTIERRPGGYAQLTISGAVEGAMLTAQLAQAVQSDLHTQLGITLSKLESMHSGPESMSDPYVDRV